MDRRTFPVAELLEAVPDFVWALLGLMVAAVGLGGALGLGLRFFHWAAG